MRGALGRAQTDPREKSGMRVKRRVLAANVLIVLTAASLLSGCSVGAPAATIPGTAETPPIVLVVASDLFLVGSPRVPFVLFDGNKPFAGAESIEVTAYELNGATSTPGWSGEATPYTDYELPYWVVYPQLPHAGYWGLGATIHLSDGGVTTGEFVIEAVDRSDSPGIGDRPPASHNRTLSTEPDIRKLSSDAEPDLELYQLTVADALNSELPTVVTFATPGYCTSQLCAPVVNTVKAVAEKLRGKANFIHVEVYKTFDPLVYADEMQEWRLTSEPWTFVIDKQGVITGRLGGPVSPSELTQALTPDLAP
jgi:hypothetical protein